MKDLTHGNIYKTFIIFAIPMVLSGILSQAYSLIDTIIAGKYIGSEGLAAISATAALITVINSVFWGFGNGFAIYIAKLFGAKEYKKIKSAVYSFLFLLISLTILIAVTMILSFDFISDWLQIDASIKEDSFIYFSIVCAGMFTLLFNSNCVYLMNAFGISQFPFYMSLLTGVLNVFGNIFTVTVLGLGITGIALSTVISSLIASICNIFKLRKCFAEMDVSKEKIKIGIVEIKESMAYALPVMFQQMIMYVAGLIISPAINGIGAAATAAYAVVTRVYDLSASVFQNSAKTLSNFAAQCIGARKYKKIKVGIRVGLIQGFLFMLPFLIISVFFAEQFCGAFFKKGFIGEALDLSIIFSRNYMPFIIFAFINNLFHALFRGVKAMKYLVISTAVASVMRVLFTIILIPRFGMSGMYMGWSISWIAESLFAGAVYFSGNWQPEEMKKLRRQENYLI